MATVVHIAQVEDGTKTAPGYSFRQGTDTGIYRIGASNIGISCGDTKIVDINTSGLNAIVGATTPAAGTFTTLTGAPIILTSGPRLTAATAAAFAFGTAAGSDVTASLGNSSNRVGDIVSGATLGMYAAQSDGNPSAQFTTSAGVRWGPGGAGALDTRIYRVGASAVQIDDIAGGAASLKVMGAFGCNSATVQTAAASGGALAAYGAGANGLDSGANMSALHALVVAIRAALVANGIMS